MNPNFAEITGPCAHTLRRRAAAMRDGEQRLKDALFNAREKCHRASLVPESAQCVAGLAVAAALAEAELRGFRAAMLAAGTV